MHELLRCRVRYFSDGLALGSREFVEEVLQRYRSHFGARRRSGATAMRHGDWGGAVHDAQSAQAARHPRLKRLNLQSS